MSVRVLYIGGSGRSGSTLVDRVIGQLPGYVSAGEVRDIARAGIGENRLCGCGTPFDACPFWRSVGDRAFGGWDGVDRRALEQAASAVPYRRALGTLLWGGGRQERGDADLLRRLYAGIAEVADGATIIDSSKSPPYAVQLASISGLDVRAIHLVRDSRGVAYSWSKTVTRPDTPGRTVEMLRLGSTQVAARWIAHNAMMELLGRRTRVARLSYERFLESPRTELSGVLRQLGLPVSSESFAFVDGASVHLEANHTVMGNPMRMATGEVPFRVDDAWQTLLPRSARISMTAATWPLLVRYGYRLR